MKAILREGEIFLSFPDAQCPKILLNSSISRSSRNVFKNSRQKMPKTMQFCYFKWNLSSLPKIKNETIFFVWFWCINKLNVNILILHYFQLKEESDADAKYTKQKRLQIKNALKAMITERKKVKLFITRT